MDMTALRLEFSSSSLILIIIWETYSMESQSQKRLRTCVIIAGASSKLQGPWLDFNIPNQ